jgi:hypothetical protein
MIKKKTKKKNMMMIFNSTDFTHKQQNLIGFKTVEVEVEETGHTMKVA